MPDKKIGIYICSGCGIEESVDLAELEVTAKEEQATVVRTHPCFCSQEGVDIIKVDMRDEEVNAIGVAACSTRVHYDTFDFGDETILSRIDLRERVAWSHEPGEEETNELAKDYLTMGLAQLKEMSLPERYKIENPSELIMVVGGGIAGLTAATEASMAGHKVELIEKQNKLGGFVNNLKKVFPQEPPFEELSENKIENLVKVVMEDTNINVRLSTTIDNIDGGPGMFDVTVTNGKIDNFRAGAIVLATGFKPYDVNKLDHLGAGLENVISSVEFEKMAKDDLINKADGSPAKHIVFVQCAGSRDENHLPYCSSHCCATSLKQANYVTETHRDATATIIYKDIRTTGNTELFYKKAQDNPGIFLTKGDVSSVAREGENILVGVENTLIGGSIAIKADLVVLAVGMVPSTYDENVTVDKPAEQMQDFDREQVAKTAILKLNYRQGTELPDLKSGFPDSHFICFPYETRRTGVYAAGSVRHPQDILTSRDDATGAVLKAIQSTKLIAAGEAVHPRAKDPSYPEFSMDRCTQCKRCTVECPFGAINEDEKANPIPFPTRCRRCGTCLGACPVQIINFKNYSIQMIGSMIKSVEVPDEDSGKLRVLAFVCEKNELK